MRRVNSLSDVQLVLNELLDWKNNQISKAKDQRGLQIKNGGDATDPTDLPTFRQLTEGLKKKTFIEEAARGAAVGGQTYWRTLLIKDSAIGNNIADNLLVQATGVGKRVMAVLRTAITSDLTVEVIKNDILIASLTIPAATPIRTEVEMPITTITFTVNEVLRWNIAASDESVEPNGVASVTVEWTKVAE